MRVVIILAIIILLLGVAAKVALFLGVPSYAIGWNDIVVGMGFFVVMLLLIATDKTMGPSTSLLNYVCLFCCCIMLTFLGDWLTDKILLIF